MRRPVSLHESVPQPDVLDVSEAARIVAAIEAGALMPLDQRDILAAQAPTSGRWRVVLECMDATDSHGKPLELSLSKLLAHRAEQAQGQEPGFEPTDFVPAVDV